MCVCVKAGRKRIRELDRKKERKKERKRERERYIQSVCIFTYGMNAYQCVCVVKGLYDFKSVFVCALCIFAYDSTLSIHYSDQINVITWAVMQLYPLLTPLQC